MKKIKGLKLFITIIICIFLTGCLNITNNEKTKYTDIKESVKIIVSQINDMDSSDVNDFYGMFHDDVQEQLKNEVPIGEIKRFLKNKKHINDIYVDFGSFMTSYDSKSEMNYYHPINCLFYTNDGIYYTILEFKTKTNRKKLTKEDVKIQNFWIFTEKTMAYENIDPGNYHFEGYPKYLKDGVKDKGAVFEYADYYDSLVTDYKVITGEILLWNKNARILDVKEAESMIGKSKNEFIEKYGKCAAEWNYGYRFLYYPSSEKNVYIVIDLNEDYIVKNVYTTGPFKNEYGYGLNKVE